ncbi:four helix bundle protein [Mucilaginibacter sp. PPCGB 2223]|uniref:four helix bundle protein n=1 Tax=Mucilaginibacter sp. PPCGB 2223 TaxID=1886027 RepID=UPI000825CCC6|nr:four helix bundle protein [Mucilaginibacter sp. PPCGB 2223]OCX52453.1 four helix bundle protein [Mucilaginibacter sp. PPCGB 2223]
MAKVDGFEDLDIWKIAIGIAVDVYLLCDSEPLKSDWGMKDQIRRAVCSLSDNIAEGFEYNNNADFIRFLVYAKGSAGEFRSEPTILKLAGKIKPEIADELSIRSVEFSAKTKTLIDYLKKFEKEKKKDRSKSHKSETA